MERGGGPASAASTVTTLAGALRPGSANVVASARGGSKSTPASAMRGSAGGSAPPRTTNFGRDTIGADDSSLRQQANRLGRARATRGGHRTQRIVNDFMRTVERTVDSLRGNVVRDSYEDVRRILATIRRQYDDVHAEADKKENELLQIRRDLRLLEAEAEQVPPERREYASCSVDSLQARLMEVDAEIQTSLETQQVYQHMVARLRREHKIVQQKVGIMEGHLSRKTNEVGKHQDRSRRVHQDKIECVNGLEDLEQEVEFEREICSAALDDLDESLLQRHSEVEHRDEFEEWRYNVALDAANEAFQATAGRYRKIYAIEKLTGNCLQKMTWRQAEQSQNTEEGFQKIREVTGLKDVMDIVHKFLNRETEHEQLRVTVREAELKLDELRDAEAARQSGGAGLLALQDDIERDRSAALVVEVVAQEHAAMKADHSHALLQRRLREGTLLFENIVQWGKQMSKSLSVIEELPKIEFQPDIVPYFEKLVETVDRFLHRTTEEVTVAKLSKVTAQATAKEHTEQLKMLTDKDFLRTNLRVPASLDQARPDEGKKSRSMGATEEEQAEQDFGMERDRIKNESCDKLRKAGVVPVEQFRYRHGDDSGKGEAEGKVSMLPSVEAGRGARGQGPGRAASAGRQRHAGSFSRGQSCATDGGEGGAAQAATQLPPGSARGPGSSRGRPRRMAAARQAGARAGWGAA